MVKYSWVTVPPGLKAPLRVDESLAVPPTVIVGAEREVLTPGLALATTRGSQGDAAPLLFKSPLYTASKLKLPALLNVTSPELGTTPFVTVTDATTVAGDAQFPFAKSL